MAQLYKPPNVRRKRRAATPPPPVTESPPPPPPPLRGIQQDGQIMILDERVIDTLSGNGCYGNHGLISKELIPAVFDVSACKKFCYDSDSAHTVTKCLYLSNIEAFYLMHNSDMTVTTADETSVSLVLLWKQLLSNDVTFLKKYIAYSHFRKEGWVLKGGLKFGVDYLLYKGRPTTHHSSYAVIIKPVSKTGQTGSNNEPPSSNPSWLSWQQVMSIARVIEGVSKELAICSVTIPNDLHTVSDTMETISEFLSHAQVTLSVVKRWLPKRQRENE